MKRREFTAWLLGAAALTLTLTRPSQANELAPGLSEETFKALDQTVDKVGKAYNAGDWKAFYAPWARAMSSVATEQAFSSLYVNVYKKQFGDIKTRKLNASKTTMGNGQFGLTVYDVTCSKKNGTLAVNWMKEGDAWKVQQVQLN